MILLIFRFLGFIPIYIWVILSPRIKSESQSKALTKIYLGIGCFYSSYLKTQKGFNQFPVPCLPLLIVLSRKGIKVVCSSCLSLIIIIITLLDITWSPQASDMLSKHCFSLSVVWMFCFPLVLCPWTIPVTMYRCHWQGVRDETLDPYCSQLLQDLLH